MDKGIVIAIAGNSETAAFATLRSLGYVVTPNETGSYCKYRAENANCTFVADDMFQLLGLVKLYEVRGDDWRPTDEEVAAIMEFDR